MTLLVVDASVIAKCIFHEEYSVESRRLLSPRRTLLAPDLTWSEVGSIAWKRVRRGEIKSQEAAKFIADLVRLPLDTTPTQTLLAPAFELAIATERTVDDCMCLALAIDRKCRFVTADERLRQRAFLNAVCETRAPRDEASLMQQVTSEI